MDEKSLINKNQFLSPKQEEKQKSAFFGEFLVLKNFNDGWVDVMYEEFKKYIKKLKNSGVDIEVFEQEQSTLGQVNVILKSKILDEDKQKEIREIKDKLQNIFNLTKVDEFVTFSLLKDSDLDIDVKEYEFEEHQYERQIFQTQYAKLLFLKSELEELKFHVSIQQLQENSNFTQSLLVREKESLEVIKYNLEKVKKSLPDLLTLLFNNKRLKRIGTFDDSLLVQINEIIDMNLGSSVKKEKTISLVEGGSMNNPEKLNQEIEIDKYSKGMLGDYKLDSKGFIISAKNIKTNNEIFMKGGEIIGFSLKGVPEINKIKPLGKDSKGNIASLMIVYGETNMYYNFIDGDYEQVKIEGIETFLSLDKLEFDEKGLIDYGIIKIQNEGFKLFNKKESRYVLKPNNISGFEFKKLERNKQGEPIYSLYILKPRDSDKYFWLEKGMYNTLETIESKHVGNIIELYINKDGKPIYGEVLVNGVIATKYVTFILDEQTGEYIFKKKFQKNPYKNRDDLIKLI